MSDDRITLRGHEPRGHEKYYRNLPFEMPPGVERIIVRYEYSDAIGSDPHLVGGNTVDIGLFDWRGADFLQAGFRGWSGSARDRFSVGTRDATPGYLPGPLTPGTWYICLGFYKVGPRGCDYSVTIDFTRGDAVGAEFPPLLGLDSPGAALTPSEDGWYRGELHCHSLHSDGDSPAVEVVEAAEALGLDFLAIMDHNNITHLGELRALGPRRLILIPGYEVTTYRGHWNIWGLSEWIDFRVESPADLTAAIDRAARTAVLVSCNHPRQYGPPWEYEDVGGFGCVEAWNGPWWLANAEALEFWEARLRQGQRLVAVGGSDMHRLKSEHAARLATPTTWIHCPGAPTAAGLLEALASGHAFISEGPAGPRLTLTCGPAMMGDAAPRPASSIAEVRARVRDGAGRRLELLGAGGVIDSRPVVSGDECFDLTLPVADTPYVRAQLVNPDDAALSVVALTNPIYFY